MKNHDRVGLILLLVFVTAAGANIIGLMKTETMEFIFRVLFQLFGLHIVVFSRALAEDAEQRYNATPQWYKRVFGPPTFLRSAGFLVWANRIFGTLFFIGGILSFLQSRK